MSHITLVLLTIILVATGQLLFKQSAIWQSTRDLPLLMQYLANPWFISAIISLGLGTLFWTQALNVASLSSIYPLTAITYLVVPLGGILLFGERMTTTAILGMVIIVIGVILVVSASGTS